jgi:hypothetical protein
MTGKPLEIEGTVIILVGTRQCRVLIHTAFFKIINHRHHIVEVIRESPLHYIYEELK